MKYCIEENNSLHIGGTGWNPRLAKMCGLQNNKDAPKVPFDIGGGKTLREYRSEFEPTSEYEISSPVSGSIVEEVWIDKSTKINVSVDKAKEIKLSKVPQIRWEHEVAGVTIDIYDIDTDRESQVKLIGMILEAQADPNFVIKWKTKKGFVQLDAQQAAYIAKAASLYVNKCYANEDVLTEAIKSANTFEEVMEVDLTSGWPVGIKED